MKLSKRVQVLTPSSTLAISAKAQELKKQGEDVIGLGVGEPDFNTPEYIIKAAEKAMYDGLTKYTASSGVVELREAISQKLLDDNNLSYSADEIIITTGAKHALYTAFQAILDEGDEVIRSEEHTSELQSRGHLVCRLLLEKKKNITSIQ